MRVWLAHPGHWNSLPSMAPTTIPKTFADNHQHNRQPDTMKRKLGGHLRQRRQNLIPCSLGRRRPRKKAREEDQGKRNAMHESVAATQLMTCYTPAPLCSFCIRKFRLNWAPILLSPSRRRIPKRPKGFAFKQQDGSSYHSPNTLFGQVHPALALLLLPSAVTQWAAFLHRSKVYLKICHSGK